MAQRRIYVDSDFVFKLEVKRLELEKTLCKKIPMAEFTKNLDVKIQDDKVETWKKRSWKI